MVKATNPYHKNTIVKYTLMVFKRIANITSESASKYYDGTPLSNSSLIYKDNIGFVENEASAKAIGSITDISETKNTIEITYNKEKYKEDNYILSTNEGTLSILNYVPRKRAVNIATFAS